MSKIILGDGLLGTELVKQTGWDYISRKKDGIDFTDYSTYEHHLESYNEIINCIAYTDTYSEEKDRHLYWHDLGKLRSGNYFAGNWNLINYMLDVRNLPEEIYWFIQRYNFSNNNRTI